MYIEFDGGVATESSLTPLTIIHSEVYKPLWRDAFICA